MSKGDLGDNQILVRIYFRTIEDQEKKKGKIKVDKNLEGKAFCLRCNDWYQDNSGHIAISIETTMTGRYYFLHFTITI
jgi:hypothetical protein